MYVVEWGILTTQADDEDAPCVRKRKGKKEFDIGEDVRPALVAFFKAEDNPMNDWVTLTLDKTR